MQPKPKVSEIGPTAFSLLGHTLDPGLKHARKGWGSTAPPPPHIIVPDDDVGPVAVVPFDDDVPPAPPVHS